MVFQKDFVVFTTDPLILSPVKAVICFLLWLDSQDIMFPIPWEGVAGEDKEQGTSSQKEVDKNHTQIAERKKAASDKLTRFAEQISACFFLL